MARNGLRAIELGLRVRRNPFRWRVSAFFSFQTFLFSPECLRAMYFAPEKREQGREARRLEKGSIVNLKEKNAAEFHRSSLLAMGNFSESGGRAPFFYGVIIVFDYPLPADGCVRVRVHVLLARSHVT